MENEMDWRTTTLSDLEILQRCALNNDFFANNYSAVNSVLYQKKFNSQIAVEDGWIFEKYVAHDKTRFSFPHHAEGNREGVYDALEMLACGIVDSARTLIFENITREEKEILERKFPYGKFIPAPESGDYIYKTENLSALAGKKLSRKRNHIHQFQGKYPEYSFELLSEKNADAARQVEEKWLEENASPDSPAENLSDLQIERKIILYALENFSDFSKSCGMAGGLLFAEEKPVAFCLASLLSSNVTDIHFEKCISPYARDGGYAVINNEFAKTVQTEFINREEDLGIEGLRKAKLSYYPEQVLEKWNVEIDI